jgi:hypothetical protein
MIKEILNLLMMDSHYGQSETIEIAKGKYELPSSWDKGINQIKRLIKWQRQ